jgi:N-dimethylarginine dimethylaminohydrolase
VIEEMLQLDIDPRNLEKRSGERRIWLAEPSFFNVEYVINPHMAAHIGTVDREAALAQWTELHQAYTGLGFDVSVLPAAPGLPDFVFMANQSFPGRGADGEVIGVRSRMYAEQRRPEVAVVEGYYRRCGVRIVELPGAAFFEGTGDALWYPGRRLIVGGYGFRTERAALEQLGAYFDAPIVTLELVDPRFYHLDTCLSILNEETAFYVPRAFTEHSGNLLRSLIPNLIPLPFDEAVAGLACNGHCPDGKHYIVHRTNKKTLAIARSEGFEVLPVDTSEYLKSGGSVYCMKLALP